MDEHETIEEPPAKRKYGGWLAMAALIAAGAVGGAIGASMAGHGSGVAVKAVPSIVQIVRPRPPDASFADVIDAKCAAIVSVVPGPASAPDAGQAAAPVASGVIVSADGQVLTSARALPADGPLTVMLGDGRRSDAQPGPADGVSGLALLKVDGADLPALQFAPRTASRTGSLGALVSTPNGAGCTVAPAMVGSDFLAEGDGQRATVRLQPDAANVLPGTPFLAQDGSVAGVYGLDSKANDVLPGSLVGRIVSNLLRGDAEPAAALGFEAEDVAPDLAVRLGDGRLRGAMVDLVQPGTPAEKAGLMAGDIVVEANGTPVSNASELSRSIAPASGPVQLQVRRNSQAMSVTISPAAAAASAKGASR